MSSAERSRTPTLAPGHGDRPPETLTRYREARPTGRPGGRVETSNLLAAPQNNAEVIAPLTGGTNVSAACTVQSPVGDGIFYLVVTTVNGYPTSGWLQAEVVSSTADVPSCLPA
ncbi:hypothetical protein ACFXDP_26710 [Streptomyces sp. NPDC059374]|uniref:hypothetical protein n=1 Tax=Streptomyces sp. NPDC059374 TaxID=3346814 RepID=UPI0036865787